MVQVAFAKVAGRPQSVISQWETGKVTPGLETLYTLEQRLGLAAGTLAFRAGYFSAEAIKAASGDGGAPARTADPKDAAGHLAEGSNLPEQAVCLVDPLVFSDRREAFRAVSAADVLGLDVRLVRVSDGAGVAWRVEVHAAGQVNDLR
jgi:transcriptional regulator with XRE-family HTH domain